jgi:hypothetical protein
MTDVNIQDSDGDRITSANPLPVVIEDVILEADLTGLRKSTDFGTATSVAAIGAFTLADTSKSWDTNVWAKYIVRITAGAGIGQVRTIASNTATVLTVTTAWAVALAITSKYEIFEGSLQALTTPITNTFTQLTAPGSTTGFATTGRNNHSVFLTVAAINTTVVVRIEGSADNSAWANLDISGLDTTITANGTYLFAIPETPMAYIRATFVSETGGTAATIDCKYVGH